jgi:hypothetical protein
MLDNERDAYYNTHTWHAQGEASIDFTGMLDASGITDEARSAAEALIDEYRRHAAHNQMLRDYYDGNVQVSDYGVTADIENDQVSHWPEAAVRVWSDRIVLDRFVLPPDVDDSDMLDVIDRNSLVNLYNQHVPVKGLYGCMAATVNRRRDGHALIRFHGADTFTAIPSPDFTDGVVACGMAIARREYTPWSKRVMVPTIVNLHLPHNVGEFRQVGDRDWVYSDGRMREELPTLYVFAHEAVGTIAPFGRTRITKFVRKYTDDAIRCLWHMQVSGAFYSMAKMYVLGITDDQFDSIMENKSRYQLSRLLALTPNEQTGQNPVVGQLSGNSPQPFIDELRSLATQFSSATKVPLDALGITTENPSSAQAIASARENMILTCMRDIEADKATLRRVMRAALAIEHNVTTDELPEGLRDVQAVFSEPVLYSKSVLADWGQKVNSVVDGFGETTTGMRMMGIPEEEIPTVQAEIRKNQARQAAMNALAAPIVPQQPEPQPQQQVDEDENPEE